MSVVEYFELNDIDLYRYNSLRIHANAEKFFIPYSLLGLTDLCREFTADCLILGKGSNTVFVSDNYKKAIVYTGLLNDLYKKGNSFFAQCGVTLSELAWFAQEKSVEGYGFLEDIPGCIGGALVMNAGTYDDTISQLVASVTVFDFNKDSVVILSESDLMPYWGKRESYFSANPCCILECELKADKIGDSEYILENMLATKKKRYLKQPREYPSAGSVFKRPYIDGKPMYVWNLLDDIGLRGYTIGGACISDKHPGFIVNKNNCTGKDIEALLNYCKNVVKEKYGIELIEEWKIIKEE